MLQFFEQVYKPTARHLDLRGLCRTLTGCNAAELSAVCLSALWGIPRGANRSPRPTRAEAAASHTEPRSSIRSYRPHAQWRLTGTSLELLSLHTRLVRSVHFCFFCPPLWFHRKIKRLQRLCLNRTQLLSFVNIFWKTFHTTTTKSFPYFSTKPQLDRGPASACAACRAALLGSPHTQPGPLTAAADNAPITETPTQYLKGTHRLRALPFRSGIWMHLHAYQPPACSCLPEAEGRLKRAIWTISA